MEREAARIEVVVPVSVRKISQEELENSIARVVGEVPYLSYIQLQDTMDEALNNWLKLINAKLDYLIGLLTREKEGFGDLPLQKVNLSEKGISLKCPEKLNSGDFVEIKIVLDLFGPLGFYLYGRVVWAKDAPQGTLIGVEFVKLPLDIKEKLGLFILNKERELIREKRLG
ncbi:MAG: PilZ domain-containing protein [Thermodesulfobacterium sp.]|nr:PilZ domain-containing protein [Thermodesulfobacterium sp.]